jgi:hypothetical protein
MARGWRGLVVGFVASFGALGMAWAAAGPAPGTSPLRPAGEADVLAAAWPAATSWGHIDAQTRARLARPGADYPSGVARGKRYGAETAGYKVEQRIECDLNGDGAPETVVAAQNGQRRWSQHGPQGWVMLFDGRSKRLVYRSELGWEVADLNVFREGLPHVGPVVIARGRGGWRWGAQAGGTTEVIAWNRSRGSYERLLKVGGQEGLFFRWYVMQWSFPQDAVHVCGLLFDYEALGADETPSSAEIGRGIVLVTYDWSPKEHRFVLTSPR